MSQNVFINNDVDSWPLMSSPWPVALIVVFYLMFILKLGPAYMSKRKRAFDLKYVLMVYNVFQVALSAIHASWLLLRPELIAYVVTTSCSAVHPSEEYLSYYLNSCCWWCIVSKVIDLLDTVFFILRKKQNQVTVLHVWHHLNMVVTTWLFLKYIRGLFGVIPATLNYCIHVIMYGYYLLSSFGPSVQKHLWWKKYITQLQLGQFVFIFSYLVGHALVCDIPRSFMMYLAADALVFLFLFLNFYYRAYSKNKVK